MPTTALISDIHGNLTALKAVMADIDQREVERVVCLGDIVGYGPNPVECLDVVNDRCEWALMGNHDFAVLYEPTSFNTSAEQAAFWTRRQFELEPDPAKQRKRWEFMGNLLIRNKVDNALWVHASPRRPINEYIFPDDVMTSPGKMQAIFDRTEGRCFCGHTHVPGVFTDEPDFYPPTDLGGTHTFSEREKVIINPGSVGQPRDRDPRASYAILNEDTVEFIRVEYDVQTVVDQITEIYDLNDFLGHRLLEGR
jgi:diadenosine tetraphosphatase ApaH/serine/threonine PP2A family protein phosphatase